MALILSAAADLICSEEGLDKDVYVSMMMSHIGLSAGWTVSTTQTYERTCCDPAELYLFGICRRTEAHHLKTHLESAFRDSHAVVCETVRKIRGYKTSATGEELDTADAAACEVATSECLDGSIAADDGNDGDDGDDGDDDDDGDAASEIAISKCLDALDMTGASDEFVAVGGAGRGQ